MQSVSCGPRVERYLVIEVAVVRQRKLDFFFLFRSSGEGVLSCPGGFFAVSSSGSRAGFGEFSVPRIVGRRKNADFVEEK